MRRRNVTMPPGLLNTILPTFKELAAIYSHTTIVMWDNGAKLCLRCGFWTSRAKRGEVNTNYAECARCGMHCYKVKHRDGQPPWAFDGIKFYSGQIELDSPVYCSAVFNCVHCGNVVKTKPNRRATKFVCTSCGLNNNIHTIPAENWIAIPSLRSYDSIRLQTHDFK